MASTGRCPSGRTRQGSLAMSRMFDYSSIADHILTVLVTLLLAMFVVVMFYHPA